jgi:hypothetical protein
MAYGIPCTDVLSEMDMSAPRMALVTEMPPLSRVGVRPETSIMASSEPRLQKSSEQTPPPMNGQTAGVAAQFGPRRVGYGLPCSKCKTYYAADLTVCPVCQTKERVSPVVATLPVVPATAEPDPAALEEERERFLRDFKSQIAASEIEAETKVSNCTLAENHPGSSAPAAICQSCHDHLQERVDLMEAALHMDMKDASQIVYDAVWADPSDPNKTYQNAAQALLLELRKRAGVKLVLGPLQPLPH